MEINALRSLLMDALGAEKIKIDEPMSLHTTFRVGGPADIFILPATVEDVADAVKICHELDLPLLVIGNGSNLLVRDGGVRGAVMQLGSGFGGITVEGTALTAQGGALLAHVAAEAQRQGLAGMEFAGGIPGSIGGAAAMNAGAYEGEMKDIVESVRAIGRDGEIIEYTNADMQYAYRNSRALHEGLVIAEVKLKLRHGDREAIKALMDDFNARRREKQPLELPSAGSFFKRPTGYFAGKLISDAGLKGAAVGGAQVSEKHAGFIVNTGGATAADVLALEELVRGRVKALYGVELEREVRLVGED